MHFYPRPPRGGRLVDDLLKTYKAMISIHALREEGDDLRMSIALQHIFISIHALREEGDHAASKWWTMQQPFLSTPSARRATASVKRTRRINNISIHALREEGDRVRLASIFGI